MSTATAITIYVNDRARPLAAGAILIDLLRELAMAERKGVAVAVNGEVVLRGEWPTRILADNDRVLLIQATQGG